MGVASGPGKFSWEVGNYGSDVFAVLPTGYRRSLLCMPAFYFRVAEEKPIVVVVTPLTAIMVTYLIYTNVIHILPVCTSPSIV